MESSRVFVKGLPPNIDEPDFRKHFSSGQITDIKLIPHRRIGYVGYHTHEDAARAVKLFNRSYIRMSKLGVELAKPPSESPLPRSKKLKHASIQNLPTTLSAEKTKTEGNAKKRKRDVLNEANPKLQEFLSVMQSGKSGASKLLDEGTTPTNEAPHKVVAFDAEARVLDEEPEDPSRQRIKSVKKETKGELLRPRSAEGLSAPPVERIFVGTQTTPTQVHATSQESSQAPKTDDEWLRSRTNRLLDLVHDDEPIDAVTKVVPSIQDEYPLEPSGSESDRHRQSQKPLGDYNSHKPAPSDSGDDYDDDRAAVDRIKRTSRLFIRNLPYTATEDDLRQYFEKCGDIEEIHLPISNSLKNKGFAFLLFREVGAALAAFQKDGETFQGRILHILPGSAKRDHNFEEFALSKLPLKQQNLLRKKAKAATSTFSWNSLFVSQDAVNTSVSDRLGITKSELLDPTNSHAAVKQAIAETTTLQDTKAYFAANGVDLGAFKSRQRGETVILVKNFAYGTTAEEIRRLFEEYGQLLRVLMPPAGTMAIVEFAQIAQARAAFTRLAFRRFKNSVLFLEKGPKNLFISGSEQETPTNPPTPPVETQKFSVSDLLEQDSSQLEVEPVSLFVRNLNFATTTSQLAEAFQHLQGFKSARVKNKPDPKRPGQVLSMGFGFVEFSSKVAADAALKVMDGQTLHAHQLQVRLSHRGHDAAEERRREDEARKAAGRRTKIIIKNLPFQATRRDVRDLFGNYGQLRAVRIPKKFNHLPKGFAFAEFIAPREAENAMNALKDTHLLGRRLVLEFAEAESIDPEEEIAKMQKKVGGQADKVALQQLTGRGRKKVTLGGEGNEDI